MTAQQRRDWLVNSALTAGWAAVLWSVTYLTFGAGAEVDDAQTYQRERLTPALEEARASATLADSARSVVRRVERRTAVLASHVARSDHLSRHALRDSSRLVARLAYTFTDSSLADSALLASFEGAPLDAPGRWYLAATLRFLGTEAAYLTETSKVFWTRGRQPRGTADRGTDYFELARRYNVAYAGFQRNSDVALSATQARVAALAQENDQLGARVKLIKARFQMASGVLVIALATLPLLMGRGGGSSAPTLVRRRTHDARAA